MTLKQWVACIAGGAAAGRISECFTACAVTGPSGNPTKIVVTPVTTSPNCIPKVRNAVRPQAGDLVYDGESIMLAHVATQVHSAVLADLFLSLLVMN